MLRTSMITQPYRGAQEDQLKGFVYGVGRGILGTVTKPLGGIFDLVSGAMTSLSEAAMPSQQARPRRRRPRRSGPMLTRQMALQPYSLVTAVAQFQIHRLTLFTTTRSSPNTVCSSNLLEVGEEVGALDEEDDNDGDGAGVSEADGPGGATSSEEPQPLRRARSVWQQQPISSLIQMTVDGAWLSETMREPECVLHVLPVQRTGVVVILTDRTLWCITSDLLRPWLASFDQLRTGPHPVTEYPGVPFSLSEHAYMFMLPYWRLDSVCLQGAGCVGVSSTRGANLPGICVSQQKQQQPTADTKNTNPVYLVFSSDAGVSAQRLRCDCTAWAQRLVRLVAEAQFHFVQTAFALPRGLFGNPASSSAFALPQRYGVPLVQGHPVALAFAPTAND